MYSLKNMFSKIKIVLFVGFILSTMFTYGQNSLQKLISSSEWDSLFPRRAGIYGTHPQGYTTDFYSYKNLNQAVNEMADYFVVMRSKKGVWGQLITITRKSTQQTYIYSNVDSWWYSNSTPENMVIIDFEDFLNESSQTYNKRELAAFLAHISKETTGGWQLPVGGGSAGDYAKWGLYFVHEVGYTKSNSAGTYSQTHSEFPPDSSVGYYGRGPIQLSWNYNYGQFSKFIYHDKNILLKYPDSLQESGVLAFKSAIWFWMMPQCPKPSCHQVMHDQWLHDSAYTSKRMYYKGFAHTNNIINGGLECRTYSSSAFTQKVVLRSKLYKYYLSVMGFNSGQIAKEDSLGYSTLCYVSSSDAMEDYSNCRVTNASYGSFGIDTQKVCGSLAWIDGKTYTKNTKTAHYNITKGDKNRNDSLVLLHLTVKPVPMSVDTHISCNALKWLNGKTYTTSNDSAVHRITRGASNGCDSIVKLKLTILPVPMGIDSQTVCGAFKWIDGKTYTTSNDTALFRISGGASNGCDSLVRLKLTILPLAMGIDAQSSCSPITWIDGKTYSAHNDTATFLISGGAANGCDSLITLQLKMLPMAMGTDAQTSCTPITWIDGKTYTTHNDTATYRISGGAANGCDSLVTLKLTIHPMAMGIDSQTVCNSFTWIDGKTYTSSIDTASFRITGGSIHGCDSLVTLKLTIQKVDVSVSLDSSVLKATSSGDSYQWVDCNAGFTPISGETNQAFKLTLNGRYAVIIRQNGCLDTSDCFEVSHLSSSRGRKTPILIIYPNPSDGDFIIRYSGTTRPNYSITDITGKVVQSGQIERDLMSITLRNFPKGIYYLVIDGGAIKLLKQ